MTPGFALERLRRSAQAAEGKSDDKLRVLVERIRSTRCPKRKITDLRSGGRVSIVGYRRQGLPGHHVRFRWPGYGRPCASGGSRSRGASDGETPFEQYFA